MPALKPPKTSRRIDLAPRQALIAADTDVLVVGGGPAGLGAALGAAEAGAHVILAERYGFLGGNATAALVMPLMSFHTQKELLRDSEGTFKLFPQDHGPGDPIIAGALSHLLHRLVELNGAISPSLDTGFTVPFDPEIFKLAALELLDDAGVEFLFHAFASDVYRSSNKIKGVVFETKSGPIVITAQAIVDCTGDGDIAAGAGASYEIGREKDQLVQPMTLMFRMVNFDHTVFEQYVRDHPTQWRGVHGLWNLIKLATEAGHLNLAREDILFFATPHAKELSVNSTRVTKVLGTDVWDLSYAEWISRLQMKQVSQFLTRYVPGFEESYVVQSGVNIGVRESRRIQGLYQLTADDILNAKRFEDVIARGAYPIDIHDPTGIGTTLKRIPLGEAYDIPLRCLLPKGIQGLLVAGRCMSGTHEAHSSYRVMPISMATGQAAGVCAALATKQSIMPDEVIFQKVQQELIRQGANLAPEWKLRRPPEDIVETID